MYFKDCKSSALRGLSRRNWPVPRRTGFLKFLAAIGLRIDALASRPCRSTANQNIGLRPHFTRVTRVVFLCFSLAIPAHAEMIQGYLNLPGAALGNAFASAPILDSAVVISLISEARLEVPAPPASALASKAPNQIGVAVDIPAGQRGLPGLALDSAWTKVGERQYARLTIRSPGAVSVRAGVAISGRFPGRVLSVSAAGAVESELKRIDGLSWSSTSDGDTLTLLLEIPAGYRYREGDISIPVVSHIDTDPLSASSNGFANIYPTTASCAVDLVCNNSSVYQTAGASVMKILYTQNGNSYACSGTMLADSARSYKPYVYTANHCIGSQAVADTVVTLWNLQYASCGVNNSGMPSGVVKLSHGAQLLHSTSDNDHSFLLLNDAPPAGSSFSGWNSDALTSGVSIATIGHPMGDVKKIAFGSVSYPASSSTTISGIYLASTWNIGITQGALQPGTSGGGLFTCDTQSSCYLRGGVVSGIDAQRCTFSQATRFSRFDVAYQAIKQWLGTPVPTSLVLSGWPTSIDSNTSFPVGTVTARFSDGSSRPVVALLSSSNANLLWQKDGAIFSGAATVNTPVSLTATFTENGATVTGSTMINVRVPDVAIKTMPAISAGASFSLGLRSDGTVWGWGYNGKYALGNTTLGTSRTPLKVSGISGVIGLAASSHVLALKSDGSVWAWGGNQYGQLGNETTVSLETPARVSGISGVSALAAGTSHSVALKSDGTVWSWGSNDRGQFGDGTSGTPISSIPVQAKGIASAKAISAGASYTVTLLKDGTVMAWGYNQFGQLGVVTSDQCSSIGAQYKCSKTPVKVSSLGNVVAIASGVYHVLALRSDGTVWVWGRNNGGQLGDGSTTDSSVPKPVPSLTDVVAIAAAGDYSLALKSDGTVWTWGSNREGQLGYAATDVCIDSTWGSVSCSKSPAPVSSLSGISAISGGWSHGLALKTDGSIWAWGYGYYGQLGNNTGTKSTIPVRVVGLGGQGFLDLGANQAPQPIVASQSASSAVATSTALDCLFTWAEGAHPELFSPSGGNTGTREIYSYRFYSTTRAYLGLSSSDDHFYYLGPSSANRLTDLGAVSEWYTTAGCR